MEIMNRHGTGVCSKCPSRDTCEVLCSEAECYANQDDTTKSTDALEGETMPFDYNKKMCELEITIIDLIQALNPQETAVIVMKYYGGLDGPSMGKLLGVSRQRISSILNKALEDMK